MTTTTDKKTRAPQIANDAQLEQELDTVAALITSRAQLDAERATALDALNERFGSQIKSTDAEIKAAVARCETYASKHRDRLFADGADRSTETALAVYGFRKVPASLKLRSKQTWDKVIAALKERKLTTMIRTREEADKEALERLPAATLKDIGLKFEGGEKFFVENKGDA